MLNRIFIKIIISFYFKVWFLGFSALEIVIGIYSTSISNSTIDEYQMAYKPIEEIKGWDSRNYEAYIYFKADE